jgi:SAM-dependent methyltransferase
MSAAALARIFAPLDRCGPGDAASLRRACAGLPPAGAVLDAGCGTGADLAALQGVVPQGQVTAVDLLPEFIAAVQARHPGVRAWLGDMTDPPAGPYDLIWSGGAVYAVGLGAALAAWRGHLAPGGRVAFSDLVLTSTPAPAEVEAFLAAEGAGARDAAALVAEVEAEGWRVLDSFRLPRAAWEAYYLPLEARLDALADRPAPPGSGGQDEASALAEATQALRGEIALWRRHGDSFGYQLVVAVPR